MDESVLISGGTALRVELGRGFVALTQCAIAAGTSAVELLPSRVSRQRFEADLVMDHCTMTSEHSIIRLGPWPGLPPGPDRPWLITSQNCAFLGGVRSEIPGDGLASSGRRCSRSRHGFLAGQG